MKKSGLRRIFAFARVGAGFMPARIRIRIRRGETMFSPAFCARHPKFRIKRKGRFHVIAPTGYKFLLRHFFGKFKCFNVYFQMLFRYR